MKLALRRQQKLLKQPWLSKGILISIKKQKMDKTHFLCNNKCLIALYKHYAAKLNKIKYTAKKMFFGEKFDKNKNNNPCKTWQTIKPLLPNNKEALPTINKIVMEDNEICEAIAIADHFYNYFANV